MKFTRLNTSIKEEGLFPIYLAEGEDAYFRDCTLNALRAACKISQPLLNEAGYEGETLKGDALGTFVGTLYTLPMFDEYRLVRVNGFYPTEREWETYLKAYAEKPCPSTVLVIVNGGKKQGAADLKRKKGVTYVDCSYESEETLSRWLFSLMRRMGLAPDADAVSYMVRFCSRDAARMRAEVEKLKTLLGEGGRVTCAVVEENVAKDAEYKIYELTQAASRRNYGVFTEILYDLLKKGFDEIAVLSALTSHFYSLMQILSLRGSDGEIAKVLSMNPYAVKRSRETATRLGERRVREIYKDCYTLSAGAKSGLYGKSGALSSAVAKIFFG